MRSPSSMVSFPFGMWVSPSRTMAAVTYRYSLSRSPSSASVLPATGAPSFTTSPVSWTRPSANWATSVAAALWSSWYVSHAHSRSGLIMRSIPSCSRERTEPRV